MTELIRPALYGARHPIVALTSLGRRVASDADAGDLAGPTRVEGPICESTDSLGTHDLPPLRRGDLVAIADAGAYAASQASRYNGRPLARRSCDDDPRHAILARDAHPLRRLVPVLALAVDARRPVRRRGGRSAVPLPDPRPGGPRHR